MQINLQDFIRFLTIKKGLAKTSVRLCCTYVSALIAWLSTNNKSLDKPSVEEYLYSLKEKGTINNTFNMHLFAIRHLRDYSIDRGTYNNFFEGYKTLPRNNTQVVIATLEDVEKVWTYHKKYRSFNSEMDSAEVSRLLNANYNTFTMFLLFTGARFSEASNLRCKHLYLERNYGRALFLNTKNKEARFVWFYGELTDRLKRLIKDKQSDDLVFTNSQRQPIGQKAYSKDLNVRAQHLGIKIHLHPHLFRHTFATVLYQSSKDLGLVQMALGHKKIETTMRYISLDDTYMDEGLRRHAFFRKYLQPQDTIEQIEKEVNSYQLESDVRFDPVKIAEAKYSFLNNLSLAIR